MFVDLLLAADDAVPLERRFVDVQTQIILAVILFIERLGM